MSYVVASPIKTRRPFINEAAASLAHQYYGCNGCG